MKSPKSKRSSGGTGFGLLFDQILSSSMKRPERMIVKVTRNPNTRKRLETPERPHTGVWGILGVLPSSKHPSTASNYKKRMRPACDKGLQRAMQNTLIPCTSHLFRLQSTFHTLPFRHELPSVAQMGIRAFVTIRFARGREPFTRRKQQHRAEQQGLHRRGRSGWRLRW